MQVIKKDILNCRILIIEDDYVGRAMLKGIFKSKGFTNIEEAENGKEGLKKIRSYRPDLVLMDVIMPEIDGVECCKLIRDDHDPHISNIPVIFQTSLSGISDKARFFRAGATDYVCKPVDQHEITARAIVHLEREVMNRHLRDFKTRISFEIETARETQQILIPNDENILEMEKDYRMQICGYYQSCSELGGDFWGMKSISNDELAIYMADFSGHGVNAALNVFRLHALMQAAMGMAYMPGTYLTYINAILAPMLPTGQFATMFYGIINRKKNTISYASAASPSPVLFNKDTMTHKILDSTGTVLGAFKETSYQMIEVPFNSGDCLLLYSDALTETYSDQGEMLPLEHWISAFKSRYRTDEDGCSESFAALLSSFKQKCGPRLLDDLSINAYYLK